MSTNRDDGTDDVVLAIAQGWLDDSDPLLLEPGQLDLARNALSTATKLLHATLVEYADSGILQGMPLIYPKLTRVLIALDHELELLQSGLPSKVLAPAPELSKQRQHPERHHPQLKRLPAIASAAEDVLHMLMTRTDARKIISEALAEFGVSRSPRTIKKYSEEAPKDPVWRAAHSQILHMAMALSQTTVAEQITKDGAKSAVQFAFSFYAPRMRGG